MDIFENGVLEMEIINDDEEFESEINFKGEYINTLTEEQIKKAIEEYFENNDVTPKSKVDEITLFPDKWNEINERRFEQIVNVDGATPYTQVDLTPSDDQLDIFYDKKVVLSTKNIDGVVTVTLIGQKLESKYTIQVTLTEVEYE